MNTAVDFSLPRYVSQTKDDSVGAELIPAGFWIRVGACIIDALVFGILSTPVTMPLGIVEQMVLGNDSLILRMAINFVVNFLLSALYYGYFYSRRGATPGKMLCKLVVLDAETGEFLTPGKAALRDTLGKMIMSLTLGIGYIFLAIREDKRGLHDFLSTSRVYKKVNRTL